LNNELKLLEKGPKYNLHGHKGNWLTTLALEAETAITHLPSTDRDYFIEHSFIYSHSIDHTDVEFVIKYKYKQATIYKYNFR